MIINIKNINLTIKRLSIFKIEKIIINYYYNLKKVININLHIFGSSLSELY